MICIYTDGACSFNGSSDAIAGWSFCVVRGNELLDKYYGTVYNGTNNIGELWGILSALTYIDKWAEEETEIIIYSDSAYCVNGANEWRHNWRCNGWKRSSGELKNAELWQSIDYFLNKHPNVRIEKVKGHAGVDWNDYADTLAKKGVEDGKNSHRPDELYG